MFFLLAAFMLVSLTMINMKGIDVNLPTATSAQANNLPDFTMVVLMRSWTSTSRRKKWRKDATYENVVFVLDKARTAGIQKVGLEIKAYDSGSGSVSTPSPAEPAVSPSPASD
jgi:biopolymer transport protein ExbD